MTDTDKFRLLLREQAFAGDWKAWHTTRMIFADFGGYVWRVARGGIS